MFLMVPGFQTSVMALATPGSPSVKKWSLCKNGNKFGGSGLEGENKMVVSVKI